MACKEISLRVWISAISPMRFQRLRVGVGRFGPFDRGRQIRGSAALELGAESGKQLCEVCHRMQQSQPQDCFVGLRCVRRERVAAHKTNMPRARSATDRLDRFLGQRQHRFILLEQGCLAPAGHMQPGHGASAANCHFKHWSGSRTHGLRSKCRVVGRTYPPRQRLLRRDEPSLAS